MVVYLLFQKNSSNNDIIKYGKDYKVNEFTDERTYFEIIQEFININANGTLIYNKKDLKKVKIQKYQLLLQYTMPKHLLNLLCVMFKIKIFKI